MKWRCCHHVEVSHTTVNKQHNITHLSLVPLNKLHSAPEWHPQGRGTIWCMPILFLVRGIQMSCRWRERPSVEIITSRRTWPWSWTGHDLWPPRQKLRQNKQQQRHKQRPQHFHPRLSLCSGWWCEASTAGHQTVSIRPFFFLLKRHSTRSPRITAYDSLCGNFFTLTNWAAKAPPDLSITPIVKNSGLKLRLGDLNFATQASSFKATF